MRYVSRKSFRVPTCFTNNSAIADRQMLVEFFDQNREVLSQTEAPPSKFELDGEEVVESLNELFHGKCAFCESRTYINIHWFRPQSEAQPLAKSEYAHLYYVWLRSDWKNTYAACSECNARSKREFPVAGGDRGPLPTVKELAAFARKGRGEWPYEPNDQSLVIDPCRATSMVRHFSFALNGDVLPISAAGAATVAQFGLDRPTLQSARGKAFADYIQLFDHAISTGDVKSAFDFESLEFGGAWQLLVRQAAAFAAEKLGRRVKLSPKDLPSTVLDLWSTVLGRDALLEGLNSIRPGTTPKTARSVRTFTEARQLVAIQLENFKAIEDLEIRISDPPSSDSESGRATESTALVILGENAVGKSSVLEAITLAAADLGARKSLDLQPSSFVLDPVLLGAKSGTRVEEALITLNFADGEKTVLRVGQHRFVEVKTTAMPPVFAYGAFRQYTARSSSRSSAGRHIQSLFRSDVLLANPENWLLGLSDSEYAMVARALKHIFVVEGEFDVIRRDLENRRCLIVSRIGESSSEVTTPLMSVSSGFRSVVGMVCDILAGMMRLQKKHQLQSFAEFCSLILIDEIEAHLHPRWKMQIISALRRTFPSSTIIATTHDPLCLRRLHPEEVVVLRQTSVESSKSDENPIKVEKLENLPNVENLTIEQLLTSDFFSMFSTDSIEVEERLARLGDLVSKQQGGKAIDARDEALMAELKKEVVDVIPIGSTEVQRLILEAVHEYLGQRRAASDSQLKALRKQTRLAIINALGEF